MLPPAVFWWPAAGGGGAILESQNTIMPAMMAVIHPDSAEFLSMAPGHQYSWGARDVLARAGQSSLSIFALGAEDGLSAIQSFQLLQEMAQLAQLDRDIKASLAGRRAAFVFASARTAQPNLTMENQMMPLLKKCGFLYLGAYWHYAGAHPGWQLQNAPKSGAFRARIEQEMAMAVPGNETLLDRAAQ